MNWLGNGAWALALLSLAACGGGGGGNGPPEPPVAVNHNPVASVAAAASAVLGVPLVVDGSASSDPDADALTYSWALTSSPQGSAATVGDATAAKATLTPDLPGSYGLSLTVRDGKGGTATAATTATAIAAATAFSIAATPDAQRPTLQSLTLTPLAGIALPAQVTWLVDLREIGTTTAAGGHTLNWDATSAAAGDHQVLARLRTPATAATFQDVIRVVRLESSDITLTGGPLGFVAPYYVQVRASAPSGIRSVNARLDGVDIGSLSAPNACAIGCYQPYDVFRFPVTAVSGTHRVDVVATDMNGLTRSINFSMNVYNAPQLQLSSPADGVMVSGSLRITGTMSSDVSGTTVTAKFTGGGPDAEVFSTKEKTFDTTVDLSGLTAGEYVLTVSSGVGFANSEIRRTVYVAPDAAHAFTPATTLPAPTTVLGFDGRRMLARTTNGGGAYVRDLVSGTEVALAGSAALPTLTDWQLTGTDVFASSTGASCASTCIYRWNASGTLTNLTAANPFSRNTATPGGWTTDVEPMAKGDFVVWRNKGAVSAGGSGTVQYTVYRPSTGLYSVVQAPAGVNDGVSIGADLFVNASGVAQLQFGAPIYVNSGAQAIYDIYQWRSDTGAVRMLTDSARNNLFPLTDGARVAWRAMPISTVNALPFWLVSKTLPAGTAGMVSSSAIKFLLQDGVLAFQEGSIVATTLKASVLENGVEKITSISAQPRLLLRAVSNGYVLYSAGVVGPGVDKLYSWNAATSTSALLLHTMPSSLFVSNGWLFFSIGSSAYRVPLQ